MSKRKASSESDRLNDNNLSFDDVSVLVNNRQSPQLKAAFESGFHDVNLKNDDSLLMKACKMGDEVSAMILFEYGADISFESHYSGNTALSLACLNGNESMVKLLINNKADPNSPHGHLPLVKACEIGNIAIVKLLLSHGAKVDTIPCFIIDKTDDDYDPDNHNEQYRYGPNALMIACGQGNIDLVHLLLGSGASLGETLESGRDVGFSPLTFACRGYHWELVKQFIGLGADVNANWRDNVPTPLMYACTEGNLDAVKMLLDLGADINKGERYNFDPLAPTPLSSACLHGHIELVKYILAHKDFIAALGVLQKAFVEACEHGDPELIALLRPRVGEINDLVACQSETPHTVERTFLVVACWSRRVKAVQKLLELGASVSVNNDRGFKALSVLRRGGPSAATLITLLVEHGADVNSDDSYGNTPLMRAAETCYFTKYSLELFKALLDYGADVRVKNKDRETVLDILSRWSSSSDRRNELIALCKQYEESNRRDRVSDEILLK